MSDDILDALKFCLIALLYSIPALFIGSVIITAIKDTRK